MIKLILLSSLIASSALAALPPTSTKGSNDATPKTTFRFDFPNAAITHSGTTASIATGDVFGPAASVDGEIALFDGITGKLLERATGTGFVKATSGVVSYQASPIPAADLNGGRTINAQTGTTYTLALSDGSMAGGFPLVTLDNAAAITLTVPTNASVAFPVGTQIDLTQLGAGAVTVTPAGGVTINTASGGLVMSQHQAATLVKIATNTWEYFADYDSAAITSLTGDVTATGPGAAAATIANLAVTNAKIANSTIDLTTKVTGVLPSANVGGGRTINAQSGTTYTFALSDASNAGGFPLVTGSNAGATTYTIPPQSSVTWLAGAQIEVCQLGAGAITFAPGAGVTINSPGSDLTIGDRYVCVTAVRTASDVWLLTGNLVP